MFLLLPVAAQAAPVDVAVLLCEAPEICADDAGWVATVRGPASPPPVDLVALLDLDAAGDAVPRARFDAALKAARAAAAQGKWAAAGDAAKDAEAALEAIRGRVEPQDLVDVHTILGAAAFARGADKGHEHRFREAAALGWGPVNPIALPEATQRAYLDEHRKLLVGGTGTLELGEPPAGTTYAVDGVEIAEGERVVKLLPGTHRVTATSPGMVRTWRALVPVLAGRTSAVTAAFSPADRSAWVEAELRGAFDTLQAAPEATTLLSAWATGRGIDRVELMWVDARAAAADAPAMAISGADPLRPAASAGERVDHGDGIPSTYEEEVVALAEARAETRGREPDRRLRRVWYDAATGRFSAEPGPVTLRESAQEARFAAGARVGYARMFDQHHVAVDLGATYAFAHGLAAEGRLGLVRAEAPYNLYADWVDQQLYHVNLAARWTGPWTVAPYVSLGPEMYVPVAVGGRLGVGGRARIERRWNAELEVAGSLLDTGTTWGANAALSRAF